MSEEGRLATGHEAGPCTGQAVAADIPSLPHPPPCVRQMALGAMLGSGLARKPKSQVVRQLGAEPGLTVDPLTATQCMREIDALRLYKPSVAERERINIPDSIERLNLHDHKLFMTACGFSKGVRFSSADIAHATRLVSRLEEAFACLDKQFQVLPVPAKKMLLGKVDEVQDPQSRTALESFTSQASLYLSTYSEAMAFVRRKHCDLASRPTGKCETERDAEDSISATLPGYLQVLVTKYNSENVNATAAGRGLGPVDSVGSFSSFLVHCLYSPQDLTEHEREAMTELVEASDDGQGTPPLSCGSPTSAPNPRPQRYWAQRIHSFLCSLPELRAVPKDPKSLKSFDMWPKLAP